MWRGFFFFFNDTATTEIYTLSLHGALPISDAVRGKLTELEALRVIARASSVQYAGSSKAPREIAAELGVQYLLTGTVRWAKDRKSTRLNSSHANISYAVFCLKKKNELSYAV